MKLLDVSHLIESLEFFYGMIGKEGPFYFDCGIIAHNHFCDQQAFYDAGATDVFVIGKKGELVTMDTILDTLRRVCNDERLSDVMWNYDRSYYHEGYRLSKDGKTVSMIWGS